MAIPDVNAVYSGVGPTASGQILALGGNGGQASQDLEATGTATLDGTLTVFNFNWIDGTATLPFTPSGAIVSVCGGTQPAAAVVSAIADSITATKCVIRLSGAGTNANTLKVAVRILK